MLEVRLLGPVGADAEGVPVSIGSSRQQTILAALAMTPGAVVSSDRLIDILWDDDAPRGAEGTLQSYVSRLRKVLGPDHIVTRPPGYALADASSDVIHFEELARRDTLDALDEALELWRGDPFGTLDDREPFRSEAHRLHEQRRAAEERRCELILGSDPRGAATELEALCEQEPLREHRWALLVRALASSGRQAEALRTVDRARDALGEVGLEPSHALIALESEVLATHPVTAPSVPGPRGVAVPSRAARLIGRQEELDAVVAWLETHRLVTLVGHGGVGKTSLAQLAAVAASQHFESGAFWCELSPHDDPSAVVPTLALAVGAPVVGDIEETLVSSLHERNALIVLDNCEHLVAEVARLADRLVAGCPGVTILATSREPLALGAERVIPIKPLGGSDAAVELFRDRARAGGMPDTALDTARIARICEMVDGLPLAVEMAAARGRGLGLIELERQISADIAVLVNAPRSSGARHATLDAVVRWSADLLDPVERLTLERTATFAGGFDLEAARAVLGFEPIPEARIAELLGSLADRSLITVEHGDSEVRYRMLQTVRRVVRSWPVDRDDIAHARLRHARHYAGLAAEIGANLVGPDERRWAARAATDVPDLRAAVFRSIEEGWHEYAARIVSGLFPFVYERLRMDVAEWAEELFAQIADSNHEGVAAVAAAAALAHVQRGDLTGASEVLRHGAGTGSTSGLLRVLQVQADIATYQGRFEEAGQRALKLAEHARAEGDTYAETMAMIALALARSYAGDHERALGLTAEIRSLCNGSDSATLEAWADYVEGEILLDRDPEAAAELLDSAVRLARDAGASFVEGVARVSAASVRARHGDPEIARVRFEETIRGWVSAGDWLHQWVTLRNLAVLLDRLGDAEAAVLVLAAVESRDHSAHGEEAERVEQLEQRLRFRLGANTYARLEKKARRLSDGDVVELALERLTGDPGAGCVMATRIVASEALVEAVGEQSWRDMVRWHDRSLRGSFEANGGTVLRDDGAGFTVAFDAVEDAANSAAEIQAALRSHRRSDGYPVHVGIGIAGATRRGPPAADPRAADAAEGLADAAHGEEILLEATLRHVVELPVEMGSPRLLDAGGTAIALTWG